MVNVAGISTNVRSGPFGVAFYKTAHRGELDASLATAPASRFFDAIVTHATSGLAGHSVL